MVSIAPFGSCDRGDAVCITLSNTAGTKIELLNYGAIIRAITVPDRDGNPTDVVLGFDSLTQYLTNDTYTGVCAGRYCSRTARSELLLNGATYPLSANEGRNHLHGGVMGFDQHFWDYTTTDNAVTFSRTSPHLEMGYPGNLQVSVTYTLVSPAHLTLTYRATTDCDTVVNLTNHSYFNLSGQHSGSVAGQSVQIYADFHTPCGAENLVTGEILPVQHTPLDLRQPVVLGDRLDHAMLAGTRGFDNNFVLNAHDATQPVARGFSPDTGIMLAVYTNAPCVQLYTAGFYAARAGKNGAQYAPRNGFCLETQDYPDACHHANFPCSILRAGQTYAQDTAFVFTVSQ